MRTRAQVKDKDGEQKPSFMRIMGQIADKVGLDLGPIAMSLEESKTSTRAGGDEEGGAIMEESFANSLERIGRVSSFMLSYRRVS